MGTTQCPAGFAPDPSGWGCSDVLPPQDCAGATIELLGQTTCQPIGNCAGAFPPAGATLFVNPTSAPDPTHFQTIGAAIAAASSGAVIAIDAGTYVESLIVTQSLSLVGRCPAQVTVSNPPTDAAGLDVKGSGTTVAVRGITFSGARPGVVAELGSDLTMTDDVIDANRDVGLLVQNPGTTATLTNTVVRGTLNPPPASLGWGAYASLGGKLTMMSSAVVANKQVGVSLSDNGSTATLTQVVVRDTQAGSTGVANGIDVQAGTQLTLVSSAVLASAGVALALAGSSANVTTSVLRDTTSAVDGTGGNGISALSGSTLSLDSSWLLRNREVAISLAGPGTTGKITNSTVIDTQPNAMNQFGAGVGAQTGAQLTLTGSAVVKSLYYGVFATDAKTSAEIDHCLVRDTALDHVDGVGRNVDIQDGAKGVLVGTTVAGSAGEALLVDSQYFASTLDATQTLVLGGVVGLYVRLGGTATVQQSAILGSSVTGLYLTADEGAGKVHSKATMTDSVIRDTQAGQGEPGLGVLSAGIVSLTRVTVNHSAGGGLWAANNAQPDGGVDTTGSTATLTSCVVRDTQALNGGEGHGIVGLQAGVVNLLGCTVTGNAGAGAVFESASGLISGGSISNNAVGLDVGGASTLMQLAQAPATVTPGVVVVTTDTTFSGNQTNLSSQTLPLPVLSLMQ